MSATAHSPTTTTATNRSTTNLPLSLVAPYSPHRGEISPVCEPNSANSSPLYSGGRAHDESLTALGQANESFRIGPVLTSSTPVKDGDEEAGNEAAATGPREPSTPLSSDAAMGPPASASVGKRKRDSLESDCSMVMPSEGRVTRSVKRLKRLNSTAVRKGLRRNLSFSAMKSPFTSLLRRGRSSAMDTSVTSQADCSDITDCGAPDNSPTFKTPIALPPINNSNCAAEWRAPSALGDSVWLPEIEEEAGSAVSVVVDQPEGKRAPASEDPAVECLF